MSARGGDEGVRRLLGGGWAIRVKRVDERTGKVVNRKATLAGGTKADALRERDRIRAELTSGGNRPRRMSLGEFAGEWLERRRSKLKASVARKYEYSLRHVRAALGALYLDAIAPSHIDQYVAKRLTTAAGNTVLNELRLLRVIARDSVAERHAPHYWCDRVSAPKVARYDADHPNLLTPDEAGRVLARVPRKWLGIVLFMITTGLRIGEATALRWDDVRDDVATIRRGNDRGLEVTVKTAGSNRRVPALPAIAALWGERRAGELVFPTRTGGMHRGSPLRRVLDQACKEAGAKRVTAHGLRRTFNDAARRRGSREVLMSLTGHVTEEMVQHYSIVDADEKAELSRAVAAAFGVPTVSGDRTRDPSD